MRTDSHGKTTTNNSSVYCKIQPPSTSDLQSSAANGSEYFCSEPSFMNGAIEEEYYHGLLLKDDCQSLLRQSGDFLVYSTVLSPRAPDQVHLMVLVSAEVVDLPLLQRGYGASTRVCFSDELKENFDTLKMLMRHHMKKQPTVKENVVLRTPVVKKDWEILHSKIELKMKFGEGAQAEVHRGLYDRTDNKGQAIDVAVKVHKGEMNLETLREVMHEVRIMLQFNHENIVKFYGVATCRAPMMLVMELVHGGGLNRYLKIKRNEVSTQQRMMMCLDAARGLEYIHSLGIIHRDVASRNCLYSQSKQRVLISDFGLSQQSEFYRIDPTKPLPIRWLAPEVMSTFSCTRMADIWGYGILCWEIFNNAQEPYKELLQKDVKAKVVEGYRLHFMSASVPKDFVEIVNRCWEGNPHNRPTMNDIVKVLKPLVGERKSGVGAVRNPVHKGRKPLGKENLRGNKNGDVGEGRSHMAPMMKRR